MFLLTLQKKSVSLSFIVTEIWPRQNTNSKSGFLAKTSKIFGKIEFKFFCCTTSVGMLFLDFFNFFLHERFLEIWLGQGKRYRQTDGRTDGRVD